MGKEEHEALEKRLNRIKILLLLLFFGSFGSFYYFSPSFQMQISTLFKFFKPQKTGFDFVGLKEYLASFGLVKAAFLSTFLMVAQAIFAPLPALVITVANGLLFGGFWGGLLALFSAVLAAQICYEIAQIMGRPLVVALIGEKILKKTDQFMIAHGTSAILISRLIPIIPFDPISYAAGLTRLSRKNFIMGNLLGQIPATFIYANFGAALAQPGKQFVVLIPLMTLAIISICVAVWSSKKNTNTLTKKTKRGLLLLSGTAFALGLIGTLTFGWSKFSLQWSSWVWARKAGAPTIMVDDAKKMFASEDVLVIDARDPQEYEVSHLKGAYRLTVEEWKKKGWPKHLPKNKAVIVYCTIGYRSGLLTNELRKEGVFALNLYGGILDWAAHQYPLFNKEGETEDVHPFDKSWGSLLGDSKRLKYKGK